MVVFIFNISIMTQKSGKRGEVALTAPIFDFQDFKFFVNLSVKNAITSRKLIFFEVSIFFYFNSLPETIKIEIHSDEADSYEFS